MLFLWQGSWLWHEFWVELVSVYSKRLPSACQGILFRIIYYCCGPEMSLSFYRRHRNFWCPSLPRKSPTLKKTLMPFLLSFSRENKVGLSGAFMSWMFKEIFFTVVWDVFAFWVAKQILSYFVNQSEITRKQKATCLHARLWRSLPNLCYELAWKRLQNAV